MTDLQSGEAREAKHMVVLRRMSILEERVVTLERFSEEVSGSESPEEDCPKQPPHPVPSLSELLTQLPGVLDALGERLESLHDQLRKSLF